MVTPAARREAVAYLGVTYEVSERRACSALGADRTSVRFRSSRPDDALVRARLRELAAIRRRFGYRRLHVLLQRDAPLGPVGAVVAVLDVGAYGFTESMPLFLSHPIPAEVAVRGGVAQLIRPRQDPREWLDGQLTPEWPA